MNARDLLDTYSAKYTDTLYVNCESKEQVDTLLEYRLLYYYALDVGCTEIMFTYRRRGKTLEETLDVECLGAFQRYWLEQEINRESPGRSPFE